ncbi:MAG: 4-phosphoerythronate dehydrogenase [Idiomarina sp.]|nr:4-phosphoerythronate dehydrogenase [Idiomarina sp.]
MNFLIADNIPFAQALFAPHGKVERFAGREPPASQLANADVLLVRSITQVNEALLALAPHLKFVGTATIGREHLDETALQKRGIHYVSSPGANADSVGEYVLTALLALAQKHSLRLAEQRVAIIGAGNTGQAAGRRLTGLGLNVEYYDPPRAAREPDFQSIALARALSADIISVHVPLSQQCQHGTHHLFNRQRIDALKTDQVLINASRGAVIDNQALLERLQRDSLLVVLDVWEGEPEIITDLLPLIEIATPHIAGHSLNGKVRGTQMLYDACAEFFAWREAKPDWSALFPQPSPYGWSCEKMPSQSTLTDWALQNYDIWADDARMRAEGTCAAGFDRLRRDYPVRFELCSQRLEVAVSVSDDARSRLAQLGFTF